MPDEIAELCREAARLSDCGDVMGAMLIDLVITALVRGRSWQDLLDDVSVRPPYVN